MNILTPFIVVIVICMGIAGCRKCDMPNDFGQGTGNCRLADSGLEYDKYSRVTKIGNTTLKYDGNIVVATHAGASYQLPYGYRVDSFVLNDKGQIAFRYGIPADAAPINDVRDEYSYDSDEHLTTFARYNNGTYTGNTTYTWKNGDVIEENGNYGHHYYKYDTARKWQFGVQNNLSSYVFFGLPKYRTTHIMVRDSIPDSGLFMSYIDNYNYEFDDAGKIITCTNTSNWHSTNVSHYKYDCY